MGDAAARRVLIADANAHDRGMLRQALEAARFTTAEAATGPEAITAVEQFRFRAVITDLWMPGADGISVIRATRKLLPDTEILVVTGGGPGLSIASAAALARVWGAQKIYVKPVAMDELVGEITALLPPPNGVPTSAAE